MYFLRKAAIIFNTIKAVAFVTYKEWAAYRSHILVSLFTGPIYFLVQYFIWKAVYSGHEVINGFTFSQILTYFGLATIINYLIMDFADWNLQMLIRTGRFITYILRPLSHRLFAFSQKVGHRVLGFWLEFIPVYLLFFFVFGIRLIPAKPFWFIVSLILSYSIMFFINYCVGMFAFWLTRIFGVMEMFRIMRNLFAGVFIPLSFFPITIQKIFFFLPFQFIVYVPFRVFIGSYELAGITLSIPLVILFQAFMLGAVMLVAEIIWRFGIRRFTGVGA
ncbi:MAG: ABC-2 family transporter protein [Spirochaetales bacterium]|nr:ABC-2 family transporter protein [Spirochaetales bacterium]